MTDITRIIQLLEENGYEEIGVCIDGDSHIVYDKVFIGGSMTTVKIYHSKLIIESTNRLGEIQSIRETTYETFIQCSTYYLN